MQARGLLRCVAADLLSRRVRHWDDRAICLGLAEIGNEQTHVESVHVALPLLLPLSESGGVGGASIALPSIGAPGSLWVGPHAASVRLELGIDQPVLA